MSKGINIELFHKILRDLLFLLIRLKSNLVHAAKVRNRILGVDKVGYRALPEEDIISIVVTVTMPSLFFWLEDIGLMVFRGNKATIANGRKRCVNVLEDMLGLEELWVNMFGCEEVSADDENLGGDVSEKNMRFRNDKLIRKVGNKVRRTWKKVVSWPQPFQRAD